MTQKKTLKERETEKKFGKKKYLERVVQTDEAEKDIKEYINNQDSETNEDDKPVLRNFN